MKYQYYYSVLARSLISYSFDPLDQVPGQLPTQQPSGGRGHERRPRTTEGDFRIVAGSGPFGPTVSRGILDETVQVQRSGE
jgi:hypothetical protein